MQGTRLSLDHCYLQGLSLSRIIYFKSFSTIPDARSCSTCAGEIPACCKRYSNDDDDEPRSSSMGCVEAAAAVAVAPAYFDEKMDDPADMEPVMEPTTLLSAVVLGTDEDDAKTACNDTKGGTANGSRPTDVDRNADATVVVRRGDEELLLEFCSARELSEPEYKRRGEGPTDLDRFEGRWELLRRVDDPVSRETLDDRCFKSPSPPLVVFRDCDRSRLDDGPVATST